MVDTREASVSNPCLVLLLNLNAVVPTLSMLLGNLASRVLHRIQVCGIMRMLFTPNLLPPSAVLHLKKSHGKITYVFQVHYVPSQGLGRD